jgi:hypothetical protein
MNFDELLEQSIYRIASRLSDVESEFLAIAGETLSKIYGLSNEQVKNYLWDGSYLGDMFSDINRVKRILQQAHESNLQDMVNLYNDITDTVYQEGTSIAVEKGQHLLPFDVFKSTFNPMLNNVMDHYETMANSTTVNEGYRDTIKHFVNRLTLDDDRINGPTAMRKAIHELTEQGMSTIEYESGRKMRMDSAVRNAMMTEYSNIVQGVERELAEEIGADGWQVSVHAHSAIDHEGIQGHVFTNAEFEKLQDGETAEDIEGEEFQTDRPIGMWNCRHLVFPFLIGISENNFSKEYLQDIKEQNEEGIEFHGKHHTLYEAEQEQRRLETEIRHEREHNNLLKQVRNTSPELEHDYQKSKTRLVELRNEYKELGAVLQPHAIRIKMERASVPRGSAGGLALPQRAEPKSTEPNNYNLVSDEVKADLQSYSNKRFDEISDEQKAQIDNYSYLDYIKINDALFDSKKMTPEIQERMDLTDSVINASEVSSNLIVFRGTEAKFYADWKVGEIYDIPSFVSTSVTKDVATGEFHKERKEPILIEVLVPKGTKGLYLGTNSSLDDEDELLLNRGLKYRVLQKTNNYMKLEIQR